MATTPQLDQDHDPASLDVPTSMRAVVQRSYGDSSSLSLESVDVPTVGANQVLIKVHTAALDRGTEHLMTGEPWLVRLAGFGVIRPKQPVLGLDASGVVVAVGADVTRFEVGHEVFGIANGSFAEYAAADETKLSHKPVGVGFDAAAATPVSGMTALQALADVGCLEPGQRVLVVGASGGVGSFAVQIARAMGATVDGVAGAANLDLVRSLGADQVYDYRTTDLDDIDESYDVVVDIGGRNPVRRLRRRLTPGGTLVLVGGEGGNRLTGGFGRGLRAMALSPFIGHRLAMLISTEHHSFIDRLAELLETGQVTPAITHRFPLERAADAMRQLEQGRLSGKTVIEVAEGGVE